MNPNEIKNDMMMRRSTTRKIKLDVVLLEKVYQKQEDYTYKQFWEVICELEQEGVIQAVKTKVTNGRTPPLYAFYWLLPKPVVPIWDKLEMLRLSDHLDFSYYKRNPDLQTERDWEIALKLHGFLQETSNRVFVSVEERSLELFGQEKFLVQGGAKILNQFGTSVERLKARRRGEPFVSYLRSGVSPSSIKRVLISENLSFYHTAIAKGKADLIIYGQGKNIENSFSFFEEMYPDNNPLVEYAGDLDPEGYSIFARLYKRYPEANIVPARSVFEAMASFRAKASAIDKEQSENIADRDTFLGLLGGCATADLVREMWPKRYRLAQEVLTVESWEETYVT